MLKRNSQRETLLLSPHRAANNSQCRESDTDDIDFNDVFGGPPRRASLQNAVRHSFGEDPDDETTSSRNRWSGLYEKPVFGEHEGGTNNRGVGRYAQTGDFYHDIFGGNESLSSSSPRRNVSGSPGSSSRVLSPARPLPPPRADPIASSSLSAPFSLPSKLTKGTDLPTFGSSRSHGNHLKNKESGSSSGMMTSYSFSPLSRSSSKNDLLATEEDNSSSTNMAKQDPDETFRNPKGGESRSPSQVGISNGGGHFHFSIYKWVSHVPPPLSTPLRGGNSSRLRDKFTTSSSTSEVSVEPAETCIEQHKQPLKEPESELKPLHSLVFDHSDSEQGSGTGERAIEQELREMKAKKSSKKAYSGLFNVSQRKPEGQKADKPEEVEKIHGKSNNKAKGKKVKEFVKIFNQEGKPDAKDQKQRRRSEKKERRNSRAMDDIKVADNEKTNSADINLEAAFVKIDEIEKQAAEETSERYRSSEAEGISVEAPAGASDVSEGLIEDPDEPFQVRELPQQAEDGKQLPTGNSREELEANEAKIRKWCQGKEGNIRSLLSTLQYVLWVGSGWKAVPLVDIIEGNAVKRTYQRALLCLHPDKLQQKGATGEQKFIAEKVFDILQEAWIHFNSLGSVV